jgi:two-component system phosphate regulon sensor histidine kinase PhoR
VNLALNAIEAVEGRDDATVVIEVSAANGWAGISVRDNGPGIPDEYGNQIFEKFFRVPARNKHNVKGYGLGLNFASQVMTQHGGSISLKHHSKGGAIFTLHFPNQKE